MKADSKERPVGCSISIDLTDETAEQTKLDFHPRTPIGIQPSLRSYYNRRRTLFGPASKFAFSTSTDSQKYSTVSTIRLSQSSMSEPERSGQESNEFIDITKYAAKLSGNTRFHIVGGSQFSLSNRQVIWDSKTSPLQVRCVKCVRNAVTRAVFPCGHLCLCGDCGYKVFSTKRSCPVCNKTISNLAVYSWLG